MMVTARIGIAFGGGAARGWAHIGIIKTLLAAGIKPDIVAGTSIGAVVGGCFVANRLDALERFARELTRRRVFGYLDFNMAGSGLITGQRLCDRLEEHLGDRTIEALELPFAAVATEIGTGFEVWLSRGRLVDAIRASYALPGIFRPVKIDGHWLFDGALVNPVPVSVCRALGARYVIAVNLHTEIFGRGPVTQQIAADRHETPSSEPEGFKVKNDRAALKLLQRQVFGKGEDAPGISTVMIEAFNIVQDRIARSRLAGDPPEVMICPRLGGIGPFDFHRAHELIERGAAAASRVVEDITRDLQVRRMYQPQFITPSAQSRDRR